MNELLQAKIKESRAHLAELRALRNPGQTQLPIVSQEISEIVVKILNTNTLHL